MAAAASRRIPVRLVVALSVAAVLAVFLLYTSFAGGATPSLRPSQLPEHAGKEVQLAGIVKGPVTGDARGDGLSFTLQDFDGAATVRVLYKGSVPDLFGEEKHIYLRGTLQGTAADGTFVGAEDTLVTKCPSKYEPKDGSAPATPGAPA
ncbi:MAG: cytochrome c maturation protein CcmE [Thermoleophilia bacterium]